MKAKEVKYLQNWEIYLFKSIKPLLSLQIYQEKGIEKHEFMRRKCQDLKYRKKLAHKFEEGQCPSAQPTG